MAEERFEAWMMESDGSLSRGEIVIVEEEGGFRIRRPRLPDLVTGPGYQLLETLGCGVCATDLARPFLPFDLPQVVGHEVLARDEKGRRLVIEINASCTARGLTELCRFCAAEMPTHCARRLTLGIHDLPGGFGPRVVAPKGALLEVPACIPDETAMLMEPFAAALHAAESCALASMDSVAVLGPRRLGMLLIAALAALRKKGRHAARIIAWPRRDELGRLATELGADAHQLTSSAELDPVDLVFETSGNPEALLLGLAKARRELHLKSTHGRSAGGLEELTAFVVDELAVERFAGAGDLPFAETGLVALEDGEARGLTEDDLRHPGEGQTERRALIVAQNDRALDRAIRPEPGSERSLLDPRTTLFLDPRGEFDAPFSRAVVERGLRVSSSRCGDFGRALGLIADSPELQRLGDRLVSHRYPRSELAAALAMARSAESLKVIVN